MATAATHHVEMSGQVEAQDLAESPAGEKHGPTLVGQQVND